MGLEDDIKAKIQQYWLEGLSQSEILETLDVSHHCVVSSEQLKYFLKKEGLSRKKKLPDNELEMRSDSRHLGYRSLWLRLKTKYNVIILRDQVMRCIRDVNPEGVQLRSRHRFKRGIYRSSGPNDTWHLDGNDKISPWGIYIHGCIDGFSRKIIWLKAFRTNKQPSLISHFYVEAVKTVGGCPLKTRMDAGTENTIVAQMHAYFRQGRENVLVGKSTGNQRIEMFWSILLKQWLEWWRDVFGQLQYDGLFNGSAEDKFLIRFCFLSIIQDQLHRYMREWNCHRIRRQHNLRVPQGLPNILYGLPHMYGAENKLKPVTQQMIEDVVHDSLEPCMLTDTERPWFQRISTCMREANLHINSGSSQAIQLYRRLYVLYYT